jgi:gas vesicle protein
MNSRDSGIIFIVGITTGLIAGAVIALVLAPKSGSESRGIIKEKAADIGDRIKETTADRKQIYTDNWKEQKGKFKAKSTDV